MSESYKTCFKCKRRKPLTMFYRHPRMADGHVNKCKACNKKDVMANREQKREQYSAYERERATRTERRAARLVAQKKHRTKHPGRYRARTAVSNALRDGRLVRQPCKHCGATKVTPSRLSQAARRRLGVLQMPP